MSEWSNGKSGAGEWLRRLLLPLMGTLVGVWLFLGYFPGLLHNDTQVRWIWAHQVLDGSGVLMPSDYFHPFMTWVYVGVLKAGLPEWVVHLGQLALFWSGAVLLLMRLVCGLAARLAGAVLLLVPTTWHFSVLQSSDSWLLIGLLWLLYGFTGWMRPEADASEGRRARAIRASLDTAALLLGAVLVFCARYNALPLLLPLVVLPFLFRLRMTATAVILLTSLAGFGLSKVVVRAADLPPSYKLEMMMAGDIVGIWKQLHLQHPEAEPSFSEAVPDWNRFFAKYDPYNHDGLVWTEPFFRGHHLKPVASEIRADYVRYLRDWPGAFWTVKFSTFQNPWGFSGPIGPWFFGPAHPSYYDYLKIPELKHRPLVADAYAGADAILHTMFPRWGWVMRPWIWWTVYLACLAWRLFQRRLEPTDALILIIAAAYFSTFFIFSNGFLLRYFAPVWFLTAAGTIRLLFPTDRSKHPHHVSLGKPATTT